MTRKSDFQESLKTAFQESYQDALGEAEKALAERKERRLMKTSTYDALMESVGPVVDGDAQIVHEDVLADTIAVERRRWVERVYWIFALVAVAGLGWLGGWYTQPQYAPQPWECDVKVLPDAPLAEPTILRCVGGEMP